MKRYSKRHPNHPSKYFYLPREQVYGGNFWKWTGSDLISTTKKLESLGINPKFLSDEATFYEKVKPIFYFPEIDPDQFQQVLAQKRKEIAACGVKFWTSNDYTTALQNSLDPQLSVLRQCGVDHRLGWSGDGDSNG